MKLLAERFPKYSQRPDINSINNSAPSLPMWLRSRRRVPCRRNCVRILCQIKHIYGCTCSKQSDQCHIRFIINIVNPQVKTFQSNVRIIKRLNALHPSSRSNTIVSLHVQWLEIHDLCTRRYYFKCPFVWVVVPDMWSSSIAEQLNRCGSHLSFNDLFLAKAVGLSSGCPYPSIPVWNTTHDTRHCIGGKRGSISKHCYSISK